MKTGNIPVFALWRSRHGNSLDLHIFLPIRDSFPDVPSTLSPISSLLTFPLSRFYLFPSHAASPCPPGTATAAASIQNSLNIPFPLFLAALPIPSPPGPPQNAGGQSRGSEVAFYPEALGSHIPAPLRSHPAPAKWDDDDTAGPG